MDEIDMNELIMKHKFEEEVERLNKFQKNILGMQGIKTKVKDIDLRGYAKYLLKEGSAIEKREFLSCMKSKFTIAKKIVYLENKLIDSTQNAL
ncbi:MAG: hypothetical protein AAB866_02720 [Patescibacteria group bacterium]